MICQVAGKVDNQICFMRICNILSLIEIFCQGRERGANGCVGDRMAEKLSRKSEDNV